MRKLRFREVNLKAEAHEWQRFKPKDVWIQRPCFFKEHWNPKARGPQAPLESSRVGPVICSQNWTRNRSPISWLLAEYSFHETTQKSLTQSSGLGLGSLAQQPKLISMSQARSFILVWGNWRWESTCAMPLLEMEGEGSNRNLAFSSNASEKVSITPSRQLFLYVVLRHRGVCCTWQRQDIDSESSSVMGSLSWKEPQRMRL